MTNRMDPSRGNTRDRLRRKRWLLSPAAGFGGNGRSVPCAFGCGARVTLATVTVDRHPVPGCKGGRYTRNNIRPACGPCNSAHGNTLRGAA
jgi:hypothetical protein